MKKKIILVTMVMALMMLTILACNIPLTKKITAPTPAPTATPDTRMQLYYGVGMQIMLPPSYIAEDIKTELPNIVETITNLIGSSDGILGDLVNNLEDNIAWYGFDGGTPAVYPTRLVVVKNHSLAKMPISLLTLTLEQFLGKNAQVDRDSLTLNGRDVTRFTYSKEGNAWAAYLFKTEDQLWLSVFVTTPANMAASIADYDISIGSMQIDPLPAQ